MSADRSGSPKPPPSTTTGSLVEKVEHITDHDYRLAMLSLTEEERKDLRQNRQAAIIEAKRRKEADPTIEESKRELAVTSAKRTVWRTQKEAERRSARERVLGNPSLDPDAESLVDRARRDAAVREAVLDLPNPVERDLILGRVEGKSFAELGVELGLTPKYCRAAYHKAVARLSASIRSRNEGS